MADVWRSVPKWWCKYCRMFVTDNKIQRTAHEADPRHRRNVDQFIQRAHLDDKRKQRDAAQTRAQVAAIEREALEAYQRDLRAQGKSPDEIAALLAAATAAAAPPPQGTSSPAKPNPAPKQHSSANGAGVYTNAPPPPQSTQHEEEEEPPKTEGVAGTWEVVAETVVYDDRNDDDVKPPVPDIKPEDSAGTKKRALEQDDEGTWPSEDPDEFKITERVVELTTDHLANTTVPLTGGTLKKRKVVAGRQTRKK